MLVAFTSRYDNKPTYIDIDKIKAIDATKEGGSKILLSLSGKSYVIVKEEPDEVKSIIDKITKDENDSFTSILFPYYDDQEIYDRKSKLDEEERSELYELNISKSKEIDYVCNSSVDYFGKMKISKEKLNKNLEDIENKYDVEEKKIKEKYKKLREDLDKEYKRRKKAED